MEINVAKEPEVYRLFKDLKGGEIFQQREDKLTYYMKMENSGKCVCLNHGSLWEGIKDDIEVTPYSGVLTLRRID